MQVLIAAGALQFFKKADEVLERSPKPIDRPDSNDINFPAHNTL